MALTKVTGQVINTTTDVTVGVLTVTNTLAVGGTVSIGGTLTYEDVTNVDSVGLITARNGINVGSGITLSKDGDGFFTGIVTATFAGDGTNLTGVASTDNIRSNTNATFLQNINVSGTSTVSGRSLVGHTAVYGSGKAQVFNTAQYLLDLSTWSADAHGPTIDFYKSRNATPGSATVVQSGDVVGKLRFLGNDGANGRTAASIVANVDGTPGTNDMPGRLVFQTTADGASTPTERLRIDSSGKILIGNSASESVYGLHHQLQVEGTNGATSSASFTRNSNDANPPYLTLAKTRGTSDGAETIVQDDDKVGVISFNAADGTNKDHMVAQIGASIDGTPGENDVPGRLVFSTTADGANSSTERLRITSAGKVGIGEDTPLGNLHVKTADSGASVGASADELVLENSSNTGMTILSGTTGEGGINFGDSGDVNQGRVVYMHNGDYMYFHTNSAERFRIDSSGNITKPTHCVFKSALTNSFGSSGSLTTSTANCGILQASAEINRGSHYTTSGDNAYTFVCPVAGIYRIDMTLSFGGSQSGRKIYVMSYTSGGGDLPLGTYNELLDLNPDDYNNVNYSAIWEFTAGTRIGVGKNGGSGTITGEHMQWAVTLVA